MEAQCRAAHYVKVSTAVALSVKDEGRVNIPIWAGVAAVVVGGVMLVLPRKA